MSRIRMAQGIAWFIGAAAAAAPSAWAVDGAPPAATASPDTAAASAAVGQPAPQFTLADSKGTARSLSEFSGKYVVLEWFNPGCPFVKKHYESGNMQKLQAAYTGKGVAWLSISSSAPEKEGHLTPAKAEEVIQQWKSSQTALLLDGDGTVGKLYHAKTTPHMVIINPEGKLIYAGAIDDRPSTDLDDLNGATNYVQAALDQAMSGQPVTVAETKPYGCSVKY
jgi:peroxiredoxin